MTGRVASLGMYDAPAQRQANDALWVAIAARLRAAGVDGVPDALDRARPLEEIWGDPGLLLAQACGYPLAGRWRERWRYVATPAYRAEGCDGFRHRSRIVVRRDDPAQTLASLRGRTAAMNAPDSNTGMNLLRHAAAPHAIDGRFFDRVIETGSHAASADLVLRGKADVATIDAVTFAHLARERPEFGTGLRTLAWSRASPCLPFVTARGASDGLVRALRGAIASAIGDAVAAANALLLVEIRSIGLRPYRRLLVLERGAQHRGYDRLG